MNRKKLLCQSGQLIIRQRRKGVRDAGRRSPCVGLVYGPYQGNCRLVPMHNKERTRSARILWSLAVLSSLLATAGCASTLPPDKSTYTFDRRCLHIPAQSRSMPVSDGERRQASNEPESGAEAIALYSPTAVHIADVMGLLPPLNRLARLEAGTCGRGRHRARATETCSARLAAWRTLEVSGLVVRNRMRGAASRSGSGSPQGHSIHAARRLKTILGVIFGGLANILSGWHRHGDGGGRCGQYRIGDRRRIGSLVRHVRQLHQGASGIQSSRTIILTAVWDGSPKSELHFTEGVAISHGIRMAGISKGTV